MCIWKLAFVIIRNNFCRKDLSLIFQLVLQLNNRVGRHLWFLLDFQICLHLQKLEQP